MTENANPVRWLAFAGAAIAVMLLLMLLPYPLSNILLLVAIVFGMNTAVRHSGQTWYSLAINTATRTRTMAIEFWSQFLYWKNRINWSQGLLLGFAAMAVIFMLMSALNFRAGMVDTQVNYAASSMFVGGIALGVALWLARKSPDRLLPLPTVAQKASSTVRMNWVLTALGIFAFAVLIEMNTLWLNIEWLTGVSYHLQFVLFVIALVLLGAGFAGFRFSTLRQSWALLRQWLANVDVRFAILLSAITALAAILRFWQLGQTARFEVDELQAIVAVNRLVGQPDVPILTVIKPLHWNWAWLFPYVETQFVNLIGHNWTGLRVIGALFGTLTIPLQYALAHAWFDRKTALIAALLLAVFPPFIHFSRFSLINIADPLVGTLTFACLSWGMRTNRRIFYVLGGVALGMSQYFYEGGRLLYPPLAFAWFVALAVFWRRDFNRRYALMALVIAFLVALPFHLTLQAQGRPIGERLDDDFVGWTFFTTPTNPIVRHIIQPFLTFIHDPDSSIAYMYYGGSQPLLLWYMVAPFLLGCFYMVWRLLKPGMLLLALWLLLVILGNILLRDNGAVVRYLAIFPVLTLLAAVGIRYTLPLIWPHNGRYPALALALLAVVFSIAQVSYYFGTHAPQYETAFRWLRPGRDLDDAVLRASFLPANTQVHIITDWPDVDNYYKTQVAWTSEYFLGKNTQRSVDVLGQQDFTLEYLHRLPDMMNQAFFVVPGDQAVLDRISSRFRYTTGTPSPYPDIPADEQYILYYVPAS